MKIQAIEYEELFPTGVYANQRYRAIGTLEDGDDFSTCFKELKDKVEKVFIDLNPQIGWNGTPDRIVYSAPSAGESNEPPPSSQEQAFKDLINSKYQTKKTLENLRPQVEAMNNPEITETYLLKLKSFE